MLLAGWQTFMLFYLPKLVSMTHGFRPHLLTMASETLSDPAPVCPLYRPLANLYQPQATVPFFLLLQYHNSFPPRGLCCLFCQENVPELAGSFSSFRFPFKCHFLRSPPYLNPFYLNQHLPLHKFTFHLIGLSIFI